MQKAWYAMTWICSIKTLVHDISNLFPIHFSLQPNWYPLEKEILCLCIIFDNLGGPKHGSRQVFLLFGDSTWTIVYRNSTFNGTEIAVISLIMVRFWWSFFCFPCDSQSSQDLIRNHTSGTYEISSVTPKSVALWMLTFLADTSFWSMGQPWLQP